MSVSLSICVSLTIPGHTFQHPNVCFIGRWNILQHALRISKAFSIVLLAREYFALFLGCLDSVSSAMSSTEIFFLQRENRVERIKTTGFENWRRQDIKIIFLNHFFYLWINKEHTMINTPTVPKIEWGKTVIAVTDCQKNDTIKHEARLFLNIRIHYWVSWFAAGLSIYKISDLKLTSNK